MRVFNIEITMENGTKYGGKLQTRDVRNQRKRMIGGGGGGGTVTETFPI